ncbi:hypothetical protein [Aerosakkonema funiforme]|nr:hypothetical protein [Aerosakkonema funiforme]
MVMFALRKNLPEFPQLLYGMASNANSNFRRKLCLGYLINAYPGWHFGH